MGNKRLKGYYIHYDARTIIGVSKKIDMQLKELRRIADVDEICVPLKTKNVFINALAVLPFISLAWDYSELYEKIKNADFLYIRSISYDFKTNKFLKWIRKNNPYCTIISEIPTYSKKEEVSSLQGRVLYPKTLYNKRRLARYIDRYVTYSLDDIIYGVQTIRIQNGIIVDDVRVISDNIESESIRLIAVGTMQPAHGYERIIEGMRNYYNAGGKRKIVLYLVGSGVESAYYKSLVDKYKLEEVVIMSGAKYGEALDEVYDNSDIAFEGIGSYKYGIELSSSLKTREYLAKGLPIVHAIPIDVLVDREFEYKLQIDNSATPVDITKIIEFYDYIYGTKSKKEVINYIRDFAKKNVDFAKVFEPVISYILHTDGDC